MSKFCKFLLKHLAEASDVEDVDSDALEHFLIEVLSVVVRRQKQRIDGDVSVGARSFPLYDRAWVDADYAFDFLQQQ